MDGPLNGIYVCIRADSCLVFSFVNLTSLATNPSNEVCVMYDSFFAVPMLAGAFTHTPGEYPIDTCGYIFV
jgi:hypothetical protein